MDRHSTGRQTAGGPTGPRLEPSTTAAAGSAPARGAAARPRADAREPKRRYPLLEVLALALRAGWGARPNHERLEQLPALPAFVFEQRHDASATGSERDGNPVPPLMDMIQNRSVGLHERLKAQGSRLRPGYLTASSSFAAVVNAGSMSTGTSASRSSTFFTSGLTTARRASMSFALV